MGCNVDVRALNKRIAKLEKEIDHLKFLLENRHQFCLQGNHETKQFLRNVEKLIHDYLDEQIYVIKPTIKSENCSE